MTEPTRTKRGQLLSAGDPLTLSVAGLSVAVIDLAGTFTATAVFEYTINGRDWHALNATDVLTSTSVTSSNAVGHFKADVSGFQLIRIRTTSLTAGPIDVTMRAVNGGGSSGGGGGSTVNVTSSVITATSANTPSISTTTSALPSNPARKGWVIQNLSADPLYVRLGSGASTTLFHFILKPGDAIDDALGGTFDQQSGVVYSGVVTVAGSNLRYVTTEF